MELERGSFICIEIFCFSKLSFSKLEWFLSFPHLSYLVIFRCSVADSLLCQEKGELVCHYSLTLRWLLSLLLHFFCNLSKAVGSYECISFIGHLTVQGANKQSNRKPVLFSIPFLHDRQIFLPKATRLFSLWVMTEYHTKFKLPAVTKDNQIVRSWCYIQGLKKR
jgi:hypothetical protein